MRVWPPPLDGRDMNPLLQDPGLAMHPPVLYAGYVGFAIPFAFAVAALLEGRVDAAWGRWVRPWTLGAWCLLTGGIALGSWWAYYELGWGGFWFWDPVENASLLPWLTGTALLHSAIVVEKREALKTWTVLLAIGTFSLSLCGTFMVRSGHPELGPRLRQRPDARRVHPGAAGAGDRRHRCCCSPCARRPLARSGIFAPISREGALVLNNILLCSICAVVFTGTTYPLFADLVFGAKLSVGPPYFHSPCSRCCPAVPGDVASGRCCRGSARSFAAGVAAAVVGGAHRGAGRHHRRSWACGTAFAAAGLRRLRLADLRRVRRARRTHRACSAFRFADVRARVAAQPLAVWGSAIAHAGMGVTVAGIAGMSLAASTIVAVNPGQTRRISPATTGRSLGLHDAAGAELHGARRRPAGDA